MKENGRASQDELYSDREPGRLFPKAADCANGEVAPLFTLPLIRKPSAAAAAESPSASAGGGGGREGADWPGEPDGAAGPGEVFTPAR